jgi:hypothetical protein
MYYRLTPILFALMFFVYWHIQMINLYIKCCLLRMYRSAYEIFVYYLYILDYKSSQKNLYMGLKGCYKNINQDFLSFFKTDT